MDFLLHIVTFILSAYLAFTSALAEELLLILPGSESPEAIEEVQVTDGKLVELGTQNPLSIPEILIQNASYQKAALVESIDPSVAPATALEALVNIYCTYKTDRYIKTTTGTGFFIDTDGVILTNAHVAQFLLLEGVAGDTECVIRSGDPAKALYNADLLYISPAWVAEHAKLINDASPKGTGERDYALLYVTSGIDGNPMPQDFPALPFNTDALRLDVEETEVFATGYPAEAMLEAGAKTPLTPKQATTTIAELMTFGSNLVDVFAMRGTSIGEHGSSGGPVVDARGNVIGIISTKGDDTKHGKGSLRAISLAYINRTIEQETTFSLRQNLGGNLPFKAKAFKDTLVPFLQGILREEL
jgi:S1-C subfamily serine protease